MKRRSFVISGLGAGAALLVGWGVMPPRSRQGRPGSLPVNDGEIALNGWIKIGADGRVMLVMNRSEMGQGVHTALAMMVAEELDVPLSSVQLLPAPPNAIYGNVAAAVDSMLFFHPSDAEPGRQTAAVRTARWTLGKVARELGINATGGSSSVTDAWDVLPLAAATARARLLGAASLSWRLPVDELVVRDGVVSHASGAHAHYGELAKMAAATRSSAVTVKQRKDWRLLGTSAPRIDVASKSDGSAIFGIDVRLPERLVAVVRHSPTIGGSPGRVNGDAALKLPGVERVVRLGSYAGSTAAVAVVGRTYWHAQQGARSLDIEWQSPPALALDSAQIGASLERAARKASPADGGFTFHSHGDVRSAEKSAARRLEVVYRAPYLAHATMEPINCTVRVKDGKVDVWAPTQVPDFARLVAARVAEVPESAVTVHVTYLGGGFGRRLEVDFIGQAVRVALETGGRPVQLVWPREEDLTHDFYRPASVALMQASLDARGQPLGISITSAGDAVMPRYYERTFPLLATPIDLPDKTTAEGLFDLPYDIGHRRIAHVATRSGVPVGSWRSVGHSQNAFFAEAFIDELAFEAKQDPVAFRMALLKHMPRHAAVLKLAADKAGWGTPLPPGRARGVALHESFNSVVAEVVEASLVGGKPKVHRVVCAADVGTVVNPDIVAQQMESGVIFGLTAALYGRIDIEGSAVRQTNFPSYPMVRMAEAPLIETHLVPSTRHPGGAGEPGTPPLAPALANALFVLTGKRMRELPLVAAQA